MTTTDETMVPDTAEEAVPEAGPALPSAPQLLTGDLSPKERARLLRVQVKQQEDAAERKAQQAQFEQRQAQRRERAEQRRQERADKRADKREDRADRRADRAEAVTAVADWLNEHVTDLLIAPLIGMPALLGWDGMSTYGKQYWPGWLGNGLPLISEAGMWLFSFAITIERKKNPDAVVWPLYMAMGCFAGLCAWLNFMHGKQGPLPGSIPPGAGAGLVYAVVAVSGLFAHQVMALRGRAKVAKKRAGGKRQPRVVEIRWPWQVANGTPAGGNGSNRGGGNSGGNGTGARGSGGSNSGGGTPPINDSSANGGGNSGPGNGDELGRGDKKKLMREFWDGKVKEGIIPGAAEMNEAAGNKRNASLGYKNRAAWMEEPAVLELAGKISSASVEPGERGAAS